MADHEIRGVAESLLGSFSPPQARSISQSHSVNMIVEELAAGHRQGGWMSSVRRFFCLLVTFDLLFTCLMWLICVMIRGSTLEQIFETEVLQYNIKTSLFDIVMVAACRFLVLLLFYAWLHINNWSIIALSTGCTCAFLIAKVFVYDWVNAKEPVYQVFLILSSFTLSWGEAWFLDFRVLPQELQAKNIISTFAQQVGTERTPLLDPRPPPSAHGESTVNWFSPIDTPETSPRPRRPGEPVIITTDKPDRNPIKPAMSLYRSTVADDDDREMVISLHEGEPENVLTEQQLTEKYQKIAKSYSGRTNWLRWMFNWDHMAKPFNPKELTLAEYRRLADSSIATCWQVIHRPGWKLEKRGSLKGDAVESICTAEHGKVFRFTGVVDCPAKWLYEDVREKFASMPDWNPTILKTELIKQLGDGTELTYQVTAGGGGGLITPRDFVLLRRCCGVRADGSELSDDAAPDAYVSSGISVECPGYPPRSEYVRGNAKVGCWYIRPTVHKTSAGKLEERCIFQWLFSCDLKGRMPQFVIDAAFATVMLDNVAYIRKHAADAKARGLF